MNTGSPGSIGVIRVDPWFRRLQLPDRRSLALGEQFQSHWRAGVAAAIDGGQREHLNGIWF
jgi:hypothetical protein